MYKLAFRVDEEAYEEIEEAADWESRVNQL